MQHGEVIAMQLEPFEDNCSMHDLELAAVVFALKTWRNISHEDGIQFQILGKLRSKMANYDLC